MILLIDNYDSFSYNLVQLFGTLNPDIRVVRNDAVTMDDIRTLAPEAIILSPGPGYPKDAGICEEVIRTFQGEIPILGVCLGHQAICEVFGASIVHAKKLMHGKQSLITIDNNSPIFEGLAKQIPAARYHSLIAARETLPEELTVIAQDDSGEIMAVSHKQFPVYGLQFHPESIMTPGGIRILENFLTLSAQFKNNEEI